MLLSIILKTVLLLNMFVETVMHFISGFFDEYEVQKKNLIIRFYIILDNY